jgi:hypothetical protein
LWHVLEHEYKIDRNVLNQINESSWELLPFSWSFLGGGRIS